MYVRILNLLFQQKEYLFYVDKYYQHWGTINYTEISLLRREREGKEVEVEGALEEYKRLE